PVRVMQRVIHERFEARETARGFARELFGHHRTWKRLGVRQGARWAPYREPLEPTQRAVFFGRNDTANRDALQLPRRAQHVDLIFQLTAIAIGPAPEPGLDRGRLLGFR